MLAGAPGTRANAAPRCEDDAGGRFTNRPPVDSRRAFRPSAFAAVSCGLAAQPPVAGRAAPAVAGATPLAKGSVRRSGECVFTTRPPASRGRSRSRNPSGKGFERRFEAAEDPLADRLAVGCSASPTKTGTRPSRLAWTHSCNGLRCRRRNYRHRKKMRIYNHLPARRLASLAVRAA